MLKFFQNNFFIVKINYNNTTYYPHSILKIKIKN